MQAAIEECETIKATGSIIAFYHGDGRDRSRSYAEWVRFVKGMGIEENSDPAPSCSHLHPEGEVGVLSWQNLTKLIAKDAQFEFGDCGESICVTSGDLSKVRPGDLLQMGRALLVVNQIGKECDAQCKFSRENDGTCPISKTWVYANVVKGGQVCVDDPFIASCCD